MTVRKRAAAAAMLVLALAGCGGAAASPITESAPAEAAPGSPRCRFVLVEGERRTPWEGTPRARMNGSGNLLVACTSADRSATLELHAGNATFDGPRTYLADDFTSDGSVSYEVGERSYRSAADGGSCTIDVLHAPLDLRGSSVPRGQVVRATFQCRALVGRRADQPATVAVEDGELEVTVE